MEPLKLSDLNIQKTLAHGHNGLVHEVVANDGRRGILKFPQNSHEGDVIRRFHGQAGFLPLWGTVLHKEREGFLMPLAQGDLQQEMNEGRRVSPHALYPVALAIDLMHRNGYLHRDLHPGNMVHYEGAWYLIDFGLSRPFENSFRCPQGSHAVIRYASANQLENHPEKPADDWYSYFLSLLAAATGMIPWADRPTGPALLVTKVADPFHPFPVCAVQELLQTVVNRQSFSLEWIREQMDRIESLAD